MDGYFLTFSFNHPWFPFFPVHEGHNLCRLRRPGPPKAAAPKLGHGNFLLLWLLGTAGSSCISLLSQLKREPIGYGTLRPMKIAFNWKVGKMDLQSDRFTSKRKRGSPKTKHGTQSLLAQELTHHLTTPSKSSRQVPAHFTNYKMKAKKKDSPKKKKKKNHHHRVQKRSSGWVETTRTGTDPTSKKLK